MVLFYYGRNTFRVNLIVKIVTWRHFDSYRRREELQRIERIMYH